MLLPVVAYPHPVSRRKADEVPRDLPEFEEFMKDMWETMYHADGIGLAAPQVNRSLRLFVIDASVLSEHHYPEAKGFKKAFINPEIYSQEGEEMLHNEGCLSFPGIHEDISRMSEIRIRYLDEDFVAHDAHYDGILARIIQHEYDHIEGITMAERWSPLKKMLLKRKLREIAEGKVDVHYKMLFPSSRKK